MQQSGTGPATTLNDEIAAASQLAAVLQREQALLIDADVDALPDLTQEKAKLIAQIAVLANTRYQALAAAGFTDDEAGMKAWTESSAPAAAVKAWNDLLAVAREAKELNRINGVLIGKHISRNQATLSVLQAGRQGPALYGPDGQTSSKGGSRGLVIG